MKKQNLKPLKQATNLVHLGLHPHENKGFINPPVIHASTVLFPNFETMVSGNQQYTYGRRGNPTSDALTEAVCELEGAAGCVLTPSGLSAVSIACLSCLKSGDHFLVADTVYQPTRHFCDTVLRQFGIEITYFSPCISKDIRKLFKENTKAVFLESPGSLTFEILDVSAISNVAKSKDATVLMDNTWATPLFFKPLDHGVDISILAGTKYIVGHSDVMLGTISANSHSWEQLYELQGSMGMHVGPNDVYLSQRGLRTMEIRLTRHMQNALEIANWLNQREEVGNVYYPPLAESPGHDIWKRDFTGASGLFSFELNGATEKQVALFLNSLELFGMGYSWGGFESLAIWARPELSRTAKKWTGKNPLIRLHIGLEDPLDLKADLDRGFKAIGKA